jgi:hypothetical protein
MAGLVPAIHDLFWAKKDVDGRDKHGHDDSWLRPGSTITTIFAEPDTRGRAPGSVSCRAHARSRAERSTMIRRLD